MNRSTDPFYPESPQERWLAGCLNLPSLPLAPLLMAADASAPNNEGWVALRPVHLQAQRDHLMLTPPDQLQLTPDEAHDLYEAAYPLLCELSPRLRCPHPGHWYVGDERISSMLNAPHTWPSCSPLRAAGQSIDRWMPCNVQSRFWRKLQNEIQMIWHVHPVNQARTARGAPTANAIWLFGPGKINAITFPFNTILAHDPVVIGIATLADKQILAWPTQFNTALLEAGNTLIWLDPLTSPYLTQEWSAWTDAFHTIERDWLAPASAALHSGKLTQLNLVLMGEEGWLTLQLRSSDRWKIWRHHTLLSCFSALLTPPYPSQ